MTITISVGSGKGGVGKSMVMANLALLLAKTGMKVCLVDLDIGGADAHIFFGQFDPKHTITDFLERRVETMGEVVQYLDAFYGLQLVTGTGDTIQSANMSFQEKQRLLRSLRTSIEADVILIDTGAGTSYNVLDFFMFSDIQLCVTTPEPTSILDFYRFLKLATIRKALNSFLSNEQVSKVLKHRSFQTLDEVFTLAEETRQGAREKAQAELSSFHPLLVINKAEDNAALNKLRIRKVAAKYLGITMPDLGEIPYDRIVQDAIHAYLPVCEFAPNSEPSKALFSITANLIHLIERFTQICGDRTEDE